MTIGREPGGQLRSKPSTPKICGAWPRGRPSLAAGAAPGRPGGKGRRCGSGWWALGLGGGGPRARDLLARGGGGAGGALAAAAASPVLGDKAWSAAGAAASRSGDG